MLEIEKYSKYSDTWRNLLFGVALLIFVFGGMFFYTSNHQVSYAQEVDTEPKVVVTSIYDKFLSKDDVNQGAGDVTVAEPVRVPQLPELIGELPDVNNYSAQRIIVKDVETGIVLFAKEAYQKWSIASMTKLMSALVLLEKNADMTVDAVVTNQNLIGTHMYAGDVYTRQELWNAMLIGSSNKAAVSLVEDIWLDEIAFVNRMNEKAVELGMTDTVFVEPTGLNAENVSTPSDISLLLAEALLHTEIVETLQTSELSLYSNERSKKHNIWNTNWLLLGWIPSTVDMVAGKTGYINHSLYNFTARFITQQERELDVVVMGANAHEARFTEARDLVLSISEVYSWPE